MAKAKYIDIGGLYIATVEVPDTHELPRMIQVAKKNSHDNGTTQQYFYREDVK